MKQIFRIIKWLLALTITVAVAVLIFVAVKVGQPASTSAVEKEFVVAPGSTTKKVAAALDSENLVSSGWYFEAYIYFKGAGGKIQAGKYALSGAMSIREIAEILTAGRAISNDVRLTVIEGWAVSDIAAALQKAGLSAAGTFAKVNAKSEGYLFPDTYFLDPSWSAEKIAATMIENFHRKVSEVTREQLILASIVELEVGRPAKAGLKLSAEDIARIQEERRVVAGIFQNRLNAGMGLESDATISYITGKQMASALLADLKIDSPYNTYKYRGLPPGPIGNPGLEAIEAVRHPIVTDYFYFLTDPAGEAHYATTLAGHNQNREKYLK